jgi:glycosyltransferase involved in cell wall biosynthesis
MKLAFASEYSENDAAAFSGTTYRMAQAIRAVSESFTYIQVPHQDWPAFGRDASDWRRKTEQIGQSLSKRLREVDADVLICSGSMMIPFLQTEKPIVVWHDSTWFSLTRMSFEEYKALYPFFYECDCRILEKSKLVIFAADWVREQTLAHFGVSPSKVDVIPFGANLDPPAHEDVARSINQRKDLPCSLTFLGIDWIRKGLPLAFEVMAELNRHGIPARLNVIGCDVPAISRTRDIIHRIGFRSLDDLQSFRQRFHSDANVNKLGFLDKHDPEQQRLLCRTLLETHFMLHPAIFEPFGILVPEANAFGVPVLASNNHGPRTSIRNGINGYLYGHSEYVERAVDAIRSLMSDSEAYRTLALSSSAEYHSRLNWTVSVKRLTELIGDIS